MPQIINRFPETHYHNGIDLLEFCKNNSCVGYVRMTVSEFSFIQSTSLPFIHYNLQQTSFIADDFYLALKIVRHGYVANNSHTPPELDLDNFIKLKCLSSRNFVSYSDLTDDNFVNNDLGVKTPEELFKEIIHKYGQVLPHISKDDMYTAGISITVFKSF